MQHATASPFSLMLQHLASSKGNFIQPKPIILQSTQHPSDGIWVELKDKKVVEENYFGKACTVS